MAWNADHYLQFGAERTRPAHDLVNRIDLAQPRRIVDVGCGPGNSTQVLRARWPEAEIVGLDNSAEMIAAARKRHPDQEWLLADVATCQEDPCEYGAGGDPENPIIEAHLAIRPQEEYAEYDAGQHCQYDVRIQWRRREVGSLRKLAHVGPRGWRYHNAVTAAGHCGMGFAILRSTGRLPEVMMRTLSILLLCCCGVAACGEIEAGGFFRRVPEVGEWATYEWSLEQKWEFDPKEPALITRMGGLMKLQCVGEELVDEERHLWIECRSEITEYEHEEWVGNWSVHKMLVPENQIVDGELNSEKSQTDIRYDLIATGTDAVSELPDHN